MARIRFVAPIALTALLCGCQQGVPGYGVNPAAYSTASAYCDGVASAGDRTAPLVLRSNGEPNWALTTVGIFAEIVRHDTDRSNCMTMRGLRAAPGGRPPASVAAVAASVSSFGHLEKTPDQRVRIRVRDGWSRTTPPRGDIIDLAAVDVQQQQVMQLTEIPRSDASDLLALAKASLTDSGSSPTSDNTPLARVRVAGHPAYRYETTFDTSGKRLQALVTLVDLGDYVVRCVFLTSSAAFPVARHDFESMTATLTQSARPQKQTD